MMFYNGEIDPAITANFESNQTNNEARIIFLACYKAGIQPPYVVEKVFIREIEQQIKNYKDNHPKKRKEVNLNLILDIAIDIENANNNNLTQKQIFKKWAIDSRVHSIDKGGNNEPWERLKARYKQWKRRKKIIVIITDKKNHVSVR